MLAIANSGCNPAPWGLVGALGVLLLWSIIGWQASLLTAAGLGLAGTAAVVVGIAEQGRSDPDGRGDSSSRFALFLCVAGLVSWYIAGYGSLAAGDPVGSGHRGGSRGGSGRFGR